MSEWWTYRPVDFLMFAPRAYWRLFELHNQAVWPWPLMLSALGLAALWWLRRPSPPVRVLLLGVALAWAVVGWFFLHQRFAPIHWVMNGAAWAFGVQALGLVLLATLPGLRAAPAQAAQAARAGGWWLLAWAVLGQPLLAPLAGRPGWQAEIVGLAPDPTVFATLGLLLFIDPRHGLPRALFEALWALALAWCALSAATLATMGSAQAWVPLLAGVGAVAARRLSAGLPPAPP